MTLAGTWHSTNEPSSLEVQGRGGSYTFRLFLNGLCISQGAVTVSGPGVFLLTGRGANGPVRMTMQLQGTDQALLTSFATTGIPVLDQLAALPLGQSVIVRQRVSLPEAPAAASMQETEATPEPRRKGLPKRYASESKKPSEDKNPLDALDELIGMKAVKEQLQKLDAWAWRQQQLNEKGVNVGAPTLHMSFAGNPGTGKTTVAKLVGRLLYRYGLIDRDEVIEKGRADLVGKFVGHTADQTKKAIEEAIGGVLFIDEAYALSEPAKGAPQDYGSEALTVLVAEMENRRHELCVIVAGYPEEMDRFLDVNAGLAARISRRIVFPDFTDDELCAVFEHMVRSQGLTCEDMIVPLLRRYVQLARKNLPPRRWGNARSVRNILESGVENLSVRVRSRRGNARASKDELLRLTVADFAFLKDDAVPVY